MAKGRKSLIRAVAVMIGLVIGAGIFGVPYAYTRIGVVPGVVMTLLLGAALILYYLLYAEAILRTPGRHRSVGLIARYSGPWGRRFAVLAEVFGFWGTLLAYLIVGGGFLHLLLSGVLPLEREFYQIVLFVIMAAAVWGGLAFIARVEVPLVVVMITVVALVLVRSAFAGEWATVRDLHLGTDLLVPYGVLMFALAGASAVPEVRDVLRGRERLLPAALIGGGAFGAVLIAAFGVMIVAVTGAGTTEDALTGLEAAIGNGTVTLAAVFGLLAVTSSFLVLGVNLREIFEYDFKLRRFPAWLLTVGVPLLFFLFGAQSFIAVIATTGAIFIGLEAVLLGLLAVRARERGSRKPEFTVPVGRWAIVLLSGLFVIGAVAEVVHVLRLP